MKKYFVEKNGFLFLLLVAMLLPVCCRGDISTPPQRILVISSQQLNHIGTRHMLQAFQHRWSNDAKDTFFDYLELNAERNRTFPYESQFLPYREPIRQHRYNLIVALFEDAVELLYKNMEFLPPDVPVVFVTRQGMRSGFLEQHPNTTGIEGEFPVLKTIHTALRLMPDVRSIGIITDDLYDAPVLHRELQELSKVYKRASLRLLSGVELSTQAMLAEVDKLPPETLVIFCPWRNYAKDGYVSLEAIAAQMAQKLSRPYFIFSDTLLGFGAIGGYMPDSKENGEILAGLIEQVLKNGNAARIPISRPSPKLVVDMGIMDRYELNPSDLPSGTLFVNRRRPIWETHRNAIIFGGIAMLVLVAMLVWIVIVHMRYLRLTRRTMTIFDALPLRICVVGNDGKILLHQMESGLRSRYGDPQTLDEMTWLDRDSVRASLQQVRSTGRPVSQRYDFRGKKRLAVYSALPDQLFGQPATMWISQDISELERERKRAERMQEQNRITLEAIGDGLIATDVAGVVTFFNPVAEELTGVPRAMAIGKPLKEVFHKFNPTNGEEIASPVAETLHSGTKVVSASQGGLRSASGKTYHIADSAFPIFERNGKINGAVLVFRDVSFECEQRERINNNLQALRYAAKAAHISYFRTTTDQMGMFNTVNHSVNWAYENGRAVVPERWVLAEDLPQFLAEWEKLLRGECSEIQILYRSNYTGEIRYYKMLAAQETTSDGGRKMVFGVVQDITEFSRSERRYDDANLLLQTIIDNIPCAVFAKDIGSELRYVMANRTMGELLQRSPENLIGYADDAFLPERKDRAFLPEALGSESGVDTSDSVCVQTLPDGRMRYFRWIQKVVHQSGDRKLLVGVGVDITQSESVSEEKSVLIRKLHDYVENERIMNSCLAQTVMATDFDQNMDEILQIIAQHLHCDRVFLGRFLPDMPGGAVITREWLSPDTATWKSGMPDGVRNALLEWEVRFQNDETFKTIIRSPEELSILCVPVKWGEKLIGVFGIGFAHSCRVFAERDETILRSAAKIVALSREHGKQQLALDESIREREIIFRNIKVPIMLFDKTGRLVRVNPASGVMTGLTPAEILSRPCFCSFCKEAKVPHYCPVLRVIQTQAPARREMKINGREYIMSAEPIFDRNGEVVNIVESAVDMTEINENRRQLEKAMLDAQAADRAKSEFLATMSHELRTPLNAVIGFSELLQLGGMPEAEQQDYLKSINLAGTALLRLINDVLDLSKIEADQMKIEPEPTDLRQLCLEMEALFSHSATEKQVVFEVNCPTDLPTLRLDSLRLRQLLLNLTGNAIKFTHEGRVGISCSFVCDNDQTGTLTLQVADTGIGMDDEAKKRIFQPFVQLEKVAVRGNRTYEGSGLGLAISHRLIVRMGGRMEVKSERGKGSCFTVILPKVPYGEAVSNDTKALPWDEMPERVFRVLLVDDVPMNLKVLGAMLAKMNFATEAAGSGPEALDWLDKQHFDVVLTDMWMPGMNGEELAEAIRQRPDCAGIRIYAVTADTEADKGFDLTNFAGVLHKPLQLSEVHEIFFPGDVASKHMEE